MSRFPSQHRLPNLQLNFCLPNILWKNLDIRIKHPKIRLQWNCHSTCVISANMMTRMQAFFSFLYLINNNNKNNRTTQVSRYQKGKTNLDLSEQEVVSGNGISWVICKSAPYPRQITIRAPHHSVFYRPDALPAAQPTVSEHQRQISCT